MTFGERARKRREALGLSQNEVARRAGLNQPTLLKIEKGRTDDPGVSLAVPIARALETTVESLMEGVSGGTRRPRSEALERSVRAIEALDAAGIDRGTLTPPGPGAAATPPAIPRSRDPWPAIEALQRSIGEVRKELKDLREPAAPPPKRKPGRRRTA